MHDNVAVKRLVISLFAVIALGASASAAGPAQKAFDRLKSLVGTWQSGAGAKVEYKLTGADSALVETQLPGTKMEMVSVYHLDGKDLVMTHYCAVHNQPTMKLKPGSDPNTLNFDFVSGSNMKSTDMHMHSVRIHFLDADHVVSEWTPFINGKKGQSAKFDMHRVKA